MRKNSVILSIPVFAFMATAANAAEPATIIYGGENCPEIITITECPIANLSVDCPNSNLIIECFDIANTSVSLNSVTAGDVIIQSITSDISLSNISIDQPLGASVSISGLEASVGNISLQPPTLEAATVHPGMITGEIYNLNDHVLGGNFIIPVGDPAVEWDTVFVGSTIEIVATTIAPPVALAGDDQVVFDEITLDGTDSYDPDGSIVSYLWEVNSLDGITSLTYEDEFVAIQDLNYGFYNAALTVTDDSGIQTKDTMVFAATGTTSCEKSKNKKHKFKNRSNKSKKD